MIKSEHYDTVEQRTTIVKDYESHGFRMLHDDFDEDWKRGDEPHGTLTFTNEAPKPAVPEPMRDYGKEIDALNERLKVVEKR